MSSMRASKGVREALREKHRIMLEYSQTGGGGADPNPLHSFLSCFSSNSGAYEMAKNEKLVKRMGKFPKKFSRECRSRNALVTPMVDVQLGNAV